MAEHTPDTNLLNPVEHTDGLDRDEVDLVLNGLTDLLRQATSPYVQVCLQEAYADIAYLSGRGDGPGRRGEPE